MRPHQCHWERHRPRLLVLRRREGEVEDEPQGQARDELAPLLPIEGRPHARVELPADEEVVDGAAGVAALGEEGPGL